MNSIEININKAKIKTFMVDIKDDLPEVTATIALYAGAKEISTFSVSSVSWRNDRFDVPIEMIEPIIAIANRLERIVTLKCKETLGELPMTTEIPN